MEILKKISEMLQHGEDEQVRDLARSAIRAGVPAPAILEQGLIEGMTVVGERFRLREIFLPDVLLSARAMNGALEELKPLLGGSGIPTRGRMVIGSVHGDLHDIGKNLVGIMLKGAGFEILDLGTDVRAERFVEAAVAEKASVIGMSALLTTTMQGMAQVIRILRERGLDSGIRTIVGGAPVSESFAREIGADAYAPDAAAAVHRVKELMG